MRKKILLLSSIVCTVFMCLVCNNVYGATKVGNKNLSLTLPDRYSEGYISSDNDDSYIYSTYDGFYGGNYLEFHIEENAGYTTLKEYTNTDVQAFAKRIEDSDTTYDSGTKETRTVLSSSLTTINGANAISIKYKYFYDSYLGSSYDSTEYYALTYIRTDHATYYFSCGVKNSKDYFNTAEYKNIIKSITIKDTVLNTRLIPFIDVQKTSWYYNSVKYCYENKIINGINDYTFEPNTKLTRGMLASILYKMEGTPKVSGNMKFSDVAKGKYYYNAVLWASQKNVVNGSNGKFNPNDYVTRQDLAAMLKNYANYKKKYVESNYSLSKYSDYKNVSKYATSAMKWAVKNKIINGSNGKLNPKGTATRAEAASMIYNYCKNFR